MKRFISILLVITMVFTLTACGGQSQQSSTQEEEQSKGQSNEQTSHEKVLRVGEKLDSVGNLDSFLSTYNNIFQINNTICETLIAKDKDTLDLYPLLLTKMPEVSEDGLTYTFELKEGIKFHDGTELTSEDVVFSFNRFFDPEVGSLTTWLATMIEGSEEFLAGERDHLTGIEAIDDYHFTMEMYYPYSAFTAVLAAAPLVVYPKEACEAAGDRWGIDTLVGSGPFTLETFEPKTKVVLSKFEDYHGGAKKLDKIEFLTMDANTALLEFEAGNIDVCSVNTQLVDTYLNDPEYKDNVNFQEFIGIFTLSFNQDLEPLDDPRVREAISLATDRNTLIETYFNGHVKPAKSLLPKGIPGYDDSLPELEYNPEKAKELLAEAGYPDGIEIEATATEDSTFVPIYEILQQQYTKANITLNIAKVDSAGWFDKRSSGNVQFYILNWHADFVDPDNFIYSLYHSSSEDFLSTGNKDPEFDSLLEQGRLITDPDEKQKHYANLEYELTREKFAQAPLYCPAGYYMTSDRVTGVVLRRDFLYHYADADIVE